MSSIEKTLSVQKREGLGKGHNRRLRVNSMVPGVYYNAAGENVAVQAQSLPLQKIYEEMGRTTVFNLEIDDKGQKSVHPVLVWDVQYHPFKKEFKHVDFFGVDLHKKVKIHVPLEFVGTCPGVKAGGHFENYREKVVLVSKPLDMPQKITVDISKLEIGDAISIADLLLPAGVEADFSENQSVCGVIAKSAEEEAEDAAAAAAAAAE